MGVNGWGGEIPLLESRAVAKVGVTVASATPYTLLGIDVVIAAPRGLVEADIVEDEELHLRAPVADLGYPAIPQVGLCLLGYVPGVPRVALTAHRVLDVAQDAKAGDLVDGVYKGTIGIGHHQHVAFVDLLKALDAGAIEPQTLLEDLLCELLDRDREVLELSGEIGELQVDDL